MAIVVDASALAAITFGESEGPALADYIDGETLLAPALIDFELTNLAVTKARRHPELIEKILASLETALAIRMARVSVPGPDVLALALKTGLTAYDASYLWLARSRDAELVTLDRRLLRLSDESGTNRA